MILFWLFIVLVSAVSYHLTWLKWHRCTIPVMRTAYFKMMLFWFCVEMVGFAGQLWLLFT